MAITVYKPEWGENRPIRGVLFDMDGLVLDSEKLYSRFWREACGFYGFPMSYLYKGFFCAILTIKDRL